MKIIIILHSSFFTQHLREYQNIDLEKITTQLRKANFKYEFIEYSELAKQTYKIEEQAIYWTGSHQNKDIKKYINDILIARFSNRKNLIPSLTTILAHENKGMQGMLAAELRLPFISQDYYCETIFSQKTPRESLPFVLKTLSGAGSSGVSLINNAFDHTRNFINMVLSEFSLGDLKNQSKNIARRILGKHAQAKYHAKYARYVIQDFIPNLKNDYKALVFFDRVYILKRHVRKNDFRASGSGYFEFESDPKKELIMTAIECRKKLNTPYCSLDLIEHNQMVHLIEFQTAHFGPYTQINADYYFAASELVVSKKENNIDFEENLTYALEQYLKSRLMPL